MAQQVYLKKIYKFLDLLRGKKIRISQAILFGSYARGKQTLDSDIDIAIISNQFGVDNMKEMTFLRKLSIQIDSHIEPIPLSPEDLEDRYSTLAQEIRRHGLILKI